MLTIGVWVIAVCQIALVIRPFSRRMEGGESPQRNPRYRSVFAPLACGIASTFEGLTGPCGRRRNHVGRCMTEDEIEHLAAVGPSVTVTVEPLAKPHETEFGDTHV